MNKLHAIWMLCASLALPSVLFAAPTVVNFDVNGGAFPISRTVEATMVVEPSKVTGAGSLISKVEFYMDGVLKSTVTVPTSVILHPGPPATPKTYTFKWKSIVAVGNHTWKAIAYENSVPVSSTTSPIIAGAVADQAPIVTDLTCSPNAIKYVANPTLGISASAKVSDDAKVTKVEFYWVPLPALPDPIPSPYVASGQPGTLKNTININAPTGIATYLYSNITTSGEMRILVYDEVATSPTEIVKPVLVVPNEAPDCSVGLVVTNGAAAVNNGDVLFAPGIVTITASATDFTGVVTKVQLYNTSSTNVVTLLATSTTPVAPVIPPTFNFKFTFPALAAGTYNLTAVATDNYGVACGLPPAPPLPTFSFTVSKCEDANEPANNTKAGATALAIPSIKYAKIGSATDVDFYKIVMTPTTVIELNGTDATGAKANLPADFDMALYGPGVKSTLPIAVSENDGVTPEVIDAILDLPAVGINAPDGVKTYILKVYGYNGATSTSCYRLSAGDPVAPRVQTRTKSTKNTAVEGANTGMLLVPNPAANEVALITTTETAGEYNVAITDFLGREVKRQTLTLNEGDNVSTLDISTIGRGMYMVRLWNEKQQMVQKLSVEK